MSSDAVFAPGAADLARLGLIGDPFSPPDGTDTLGIRLVVHAEALRLLAALDAAAAEERPVPVWVEKAAAIPAYYHLAGLAEVLGQLGGNDDLDLLAAYIPLDMMSLGRIRSALSSVAEHVSNATFGRTLAAWVAETLREPDAALPEAQPLEPDRTARLLELLQADPEATIARYFGECVPERDEGESVEQMLRISVARQGRLDEEAAEDEGTGELDTTDPMAEAFVEPAGGDGAEPEEAPETDPLTAEGLPAAAALVDYVVAYTKAHLSPVVARGLEAYRAQGTSAMSQEFKVTKAPKKTLAALARFAGHRYRKVVLIYDRFDNWNWMPDDNKPAIVGALTELRWALGDDGVIVLLVAEGQAAELAEQFAAATRIAWAFPTLQAMEVEPPELDGGVVRNWIEAASLPGDVAAPADAPWVEPLLDASERDLERFSAMASAAVQDAARRGLSALDDAAVVAGR